MPASNSHAAKKPDRPAQPVRAIGARGSAGAAGYPAPVNRVIDEFAKLPGIGRRAAERLALHLLRGDAEAAAGLSRAIGELKTGVRNCSICFNLTDTPVCSVCSGPQRDHGLVLVVEQPRDLLALEQTGMYRGVYHVLLGRISPLDGVGPGDLTIADLLARVDEPRRNSAAAPVREVILGLNPTLEGDGTALYLSEQLKTTKVAVSRLARGLPTGTSLEMANKAVLADAIAGRRVVSDET